MYPPNAHGAPPFGGAPHFHNIGTPAGSAMASNGNVGQGNFGGGGNFGGIANFNPGPPQGGFGGPGPRPEFMYLANAFAQVLGQQLAPSFAANQQPPPGGAGSRTTLHPLCPLLRCRLEFRCAVIFFASIPDEVVQTVIANEASHTVGTPIFPESPLRPT